MQDGISIAEVVHSLAQDKLKADNIIGEAITKLVLKESDLEIVATVMANVIALEDSNASTSIGISIDSKDTIDINITALFYISRVFNRALDILDYKEEPSEKVFSLKASLLFLQNDINKKRTFTNSTKFIYPDYEQARELLRKVFKSIIVPDSELDNE